MGNAFERPETSERKEKPAGSVWHNRHAQLLALALLIPTPALAKEGAPQPVEVERVEESYDAFLRRLDTAARQRTTETSWAHFTSPDGSSVSTRTSIQGTEQAGSVYSDTREATQRALTGDEVVLCHTHPQRAPEEIPNPVPEGQPLPIDAPSIDDIESFFYRLSFLSHMLGSDEVATGIMERFTNCVMTSNGGYWTLEAVDLEQMRTRIAAIDRYTAESYEEAHALIDERIKSPEVMELLALVPPEMWKGEPMIDRILQVIYSVNLESPDHGLSPQLVQFVEEFRGRKRPLEREPGFARARELANSFFSPERTGEQSQEDLTAYLAHIRKTFGVKITWHALPPSE